MFASSSHVVADGATDGGSGRKWRHVADRRRCEQTPMLINGTFGSAERGSAAHLASIAAAASCGMTGGRVFVSRKVM